MDGFNSRMEVTKEIIRDLEDRVTEITQFKQEQEKKKTWRKTGPEPQSL